MLRKQGSLHPCRTAKLLIQARVTAVLRQKGQHYRRNDNTLVPPKTTTNAIRDQHTHFDSTLSKNDSTPSRLNMKIIKSSPGHSELSHLLTFYIYSRSTSMLTHSPYKHSCIIEFVSSHRNPKIKTRKPRPNSLIYIILQT